MKEKRSFGLIAVMMTVSLSCAMPLSEFPSFPFFHIYTITIGGMNMLMHIMSMYIYAAAATNVIIT